MQNIEFTRLIRIGDSKGVVIPIEILRDLQWERGDYIVFAVGKSDVLCARKMSDSEIKNIKPDVINY